jgi:hypothetical protein
MKSSEFSTGRYIEEKKWNAMTESVKGNKEEVQSINYLIAIISNKILQAYNYLITNNKIYIL